MQPAQILRGHRADAARAGAGRAAGVFHATIWTPVRRVLGRNGDRILPAIAAVLIIGSIALPWWHLTLHAPQYPRGLKAVIFVNKISGPPAEEAGYLDHVREINGLNHYIGMRPLDEGGELERKISVFAIPAVAVLGLLVGVRRRWTWIAAIPAIALPVVFTADLFYWLYSFGHELDPAAALSGAIGEFTPTLLGPGEVGQFRTTSLYGTGFYLALAGAVLLAVAVTIRLRRERRERRERRG